MKKHKNRIEIVGAYYIRIIVGKLIFEGQQFYETKSGALRAARNVNENMAVMINNSLDSGNYYLHIYDYDGDYPGVGNEKAKYKIISG